MRKTFLKVALFSLVAAPMVTSLQSCKDYDDDITEINGTTGTLTSQITNLDGQIQTLKTALADAQNEAKNASKDAESARKQAEQALQNAAAAMAAAQDAKAAGDSAKASAEEAKAAAAKAEADAAAALAMANEAKFAAAQAKADAIAEATRQAEALRSDIANLQSLLQGKIDANAAGISANAKEIAINAAAIKANVDKLNALEAKIAAIDAKLALYPTTEAMTKAINDAVEKAQAAVLAELQKTNANIADINRQLNTLNSLITSEVTKLQKQIEAIMADLAKNGGDITKLSAAQQDLLAKYNNLDGQINLLTGRVDVVESDVAGLKADVQTINATLASLQATITSNYNDVLDKIRAVETRAAQLEAQFAALETYKQQLDQNFADIAAKFSALESKYGELKTELGDIKGIVDQNKADIATLTADLGTVRSELNTLKGEFTTYKNELDQKFATLSTQISTDFATAKSEMETEINNKISELETKFNTLVTELNTKIDTKLQDLETKITAMQGYLNVIEMLPGRLTTVSLIPELYVAGVPTIEFPNISYNAWTTFRKTDADYAWTYNNNTGAAKAITNNQVVVRYRLNPESIAATNVNLDGLQFVSHKAVAVSRAAATSSLAITAKSIANGELSVTVKNTAVGKLSGNNAATGKPEITVAALQVPIAEKYLYESEKTTGAVVYSDYARVAERTINDIQILPVEGKLVSAFATRQQMKAAYVNSETYMVTKQVYNQTLDLNSLIRAKYNSNYYASVEELATWGLKPEYTVIAVGDYKYAKINGSTLSSEVPAGGDAKDVLGKMPVICVALKNGNSVVDVRYFQVKFVTDIQLPDIVINESVRHIGKTQNQKWNYQWSRMAADVFAKVTTGDALSKDQFQAIYGTPVVKTTVNGVPTLGAMMTYNAADADNALTFTYNRDQLHLISAFGTSQKFVSTVTFTPNAANANLYPEVTIIYNFTIDAPESFIPGLGEYNNIYWKDVNGVQTMVAVPSKPGTTAHPSYQTEIFKGRTFPYVVFQNKEAKDSLNSIAQYELAKVVTYDAQRRPTNTAAQVTSDVLSVGVNAGNVPTFDMINSDNGYYLVNTEATVEVDWAVYPIGKTSVQNTPIKFVKTAVELVKPLTVSVNEKKALAITDSDKSSKIKLDVLTVTDRYGNADCLTKTELKAFYDIADVVYGTPMVDGKPAIENKIAVTVVNGELVYDAENTPLVLTDKVIEIPFTIPHYWGTLNSGAYGEQVQTIKVTLKAKK